jgi:hypothetical protein
LNKNLTENVKSEYIENTFNDLRKKLLQAAKMADKKSKKQLNVKKFKYKQIQQAWTPELVNINNQLNHCYSLWLISDRKTIKLI